MILDESLLIRIRDASKFHEVSFSRLDVMIFPLVLFISILVFLGAVRKENKKHLLKRSRTFPYQNSDLNQTSPNSTHRKSISKEKGHVFFSFHEKITTFLRVEFVEVCSNSNETMI